MKPFPANFMFEQTKLWGALHFSTSKRGGTRYMPFAFTKNKFIPKAL